MVAAEEEPDAHRDTDDADDKADLVVPAHLSAQAGIHAAYAGSSRASARDTVAGYQAEPWGLGIPLLFNRSAIRRSGSRCRGADRKIVSASTLRAAGRRPSWTPRCRAASSAARVRSLIS